MSKMKIVALLVVWLPWIITIAGMAVGGPHGSAKAMILWVWMSPVVTSYTILVAYNRGWRAARENL